MLNRSLIRLSLPVALLACGGGSEGGSVAPPPPPPTPVASVSVTPATAAILPGTTSQLSAATLDAAGNPLANRTVT